MDSIRATVCCHPFFAPKAKPNLPLRARDRSQVDSYLLNHPQPKLFRREPVDPAELVVKPVAELVRVRGRGRMDHSLA